MENTIIELKFSLDTFYFLISGILVMWMAAGFAMLEAGLVRSKNTTEILTKNIALYSIACTMFLLVGYNIMYVDNVEGGIIPSFGGLIGSEAADADHSLESDFFLPSSICCNGYVYCIWRRSGAYEVMGFLSVYSSTYRINLPN